MINIQAQRNISVDSVKRHAMLSRAIQSIIIITISFNAVRMFVFYLNAMKC